MRSFWWPCFYFPLCWGSSAWTTTDMSAGSQNSKQHLNPVNATSTVYSRRSTAVPEQRARCKNTSSLQIPTVSFDLGNEWDDWGDFDDENLLHASETVLTSYATNAKPQIQQCDENSLPGRVNCSAFMFRRSRREISFSHISVIRASLWHKHSAALLSFTCLCGIIPWIFL